MTKWQDATYALSIGLSWIINGYVGTKTYICMLVMVNAALYHKVSNLFRKLYRLRSSTLVYIRPSYHNNAKLVLLH